MSLRLFKIGYLVFLGILLGRISGFIREIIISYNYGSSFEADAVVLMLTVPDLLVNILLSGGLSAALIPEFKRLNLEEGWSLFIKSSFFVGMFFFLLTLFFMIFVDKIIFVLSPGFEAYKIQYVSTLLKKTLIIIPITTITGVITAFLHSHENFGVASLGTFFFNFPVIIGLYLVPHSNKLYLIAYFIFIGVVVRFLSQYAAALKFRNSSKVVLNNLQFISMLRRYLESVISLGCVLLLPVIVRSILSYKGEGIIAIFNYAIKISDFIYSSSITLVSVVIFPRLSALAVNRKKNSDNYLDFLEKSMHVTLLLTIATITMFMLYCDDIVSVIYFRGNMQFETIRKVSFIARFTLGALFFQGISSVLMNIFNAERDTKTLLLINSFCVFIYIMFGIFCDKSLNIAYTMFSLIIVNAMIALLQVCQLSRKRKVWVLPYIFNMTILRDFLVILFVNIGGWYIITVLQYQHIARVTLGIIVMILSLLLGFIINDKYWSYFKIQNRKVYIR